MATTKKDDAAMKQRQTRYLSHKLWRKNNPEKVLEQKRRYRERHKKDITQRIRQWRQQLPESHKEAIYQKVREWKHRLIQRLSEEELLAYQERNKERCRQYRKDKKEGRVKARRKDVT